MKFVVFLACFFSFSAQACSCKLETSRHYFDLAENVFIAKVSNEIKVDSSGHRYPIEVIESLKGKKYDAVFSHSKMLTATSCDYDLQVGQVYLFMLNASNFVSYCTGTKPIGFSNIEKIKKELLRVES